MSDARGHKAWCCAACWHAAWLWMWHVILYNHQHSPWLVRSR